MGGYRLNNTSKDGFPNFAAHSAYIDRYFSRMSHTSTAFQNSTSWWSAEPMASDASLRTAPRCRRKAMP